MYYLYLLRLVTHDLKHRKVTSKLRFIYGVEMSGENMYILQNRVQLPKPPGIAVVALYVKERVTIYLNNSFQQRLLSSLGKRKKQRGSSKTI